MSESERDSGNDNQPMVDVISVVLTTTPSREEFSVSVVGTNPVKPEDVEAWLAGFDPELQPIPHDIHAGIARLAIETAVMEMIRHSCPDPEASDDHE